MSYVCHYFGFIDLKSPYIIAKQTMSKYNTIYLDEMLSDLDGDVVTKNNYETANVADLGKYEKVINITRTCRIMRIFKIR